MRQWTLGVARRLDLDIYVVPGAEPPFAAADLETLSGAFDRSSAFLVLPPPDRSCEGRARTALAVAEASLMRLDAGAEGGVVQMAASYVASLTAPCSALEVAAMDAFQRAPERALTEASATTPLTGALLFPWYLDEAYGTGRPAALITGLMAIAAQRTPPDNLAGVLVVGVNAGSMDRSRPFDPDEGPFMPRSYTVTLYP